jgi:hypothetical protein
MKSRELEGEGNNLRTNWATDRGCGIIGIEVGEDPAMTAGMFCPHSLSLSPSENLPTKKER